LRTRLIDLKQPPVTQRTFRRKRFPRGLVKQGHRQSEGWIRTIDVSLGKVAKRRDAGIELDRRTEQQQLQFEAR